MTGGWADVVTWLLVMGGWIVVNTGNNNRESRKEARATIDLVKIRVLSVADNSTAYFSDLNAEKLAPVIKSELDLIEIELGRIDGFSKSLAFQALVSFSEECTGGSFEVKYREAIALTSPRILAIRRCRNILISRLEELFQERHK